MRYLSFFSGALGLDLGLELAGWTCLGANEIDPVACATIRKNRPQLRLFEEDIRNLNARGFGVSDLDAVVGGPPCQAFSTAGKRGGLCDERGNVFLHFVHLALELNPRFIVIENVRGLLSAPIQHRPHSERGSGYPVLKDEEKKGGALRMILSMFQSKDYSVSFRLYDTSLFGVPQVRERLVLVAHKSSVLVPHLAGTYTIPQTLRDAIGDLRENDPECLPLRAKVIPYLPLIGAGENWRSLPDDLQREALGGVYHCSGGRTGFLRRLAWDKPSPTLVTAPTMPATLLAHPEELRALSVKEYARIQTFPDDWEFCGKTADKYRQIGNAVPVIFGREIGEHLNRFDSGRRVRAVAKSTSRYSATDEHAWSAAFGA